MLRLLSLWRAEQNQQSLLLASRAGVKPFHALDSPHGRNDLIELLAVAAVAAGQHQLDQIRHRLAGFEIVHGVDCGDWAEDFAVSKGSTIAGLWLLPW